MLPVETRDMCFWKSGLYADFTSNKRRCVQATSNNGNRPATEKCRNTSVFWAVAAVASENPILLLFFSFICYLVFTSNTSNKE